MAMWVGRHLSLFSWHMLGFLLKTLLLNAVVEARKAVTLCCSLFLQYLVVDRR